ncbi:MAG: amidase, partial [Gemmatimonadetes bacterium]|nr:amidase [Gemmatimonadota bacterium]
MSQLASSDAAYGQRASSPGRFEVFEATIPQLQAALESGRVTSVDLVEAYLTRIEAYDRGGPLLNSIIRINPNARAEARALDEERQASGPRGPLHGIPIILKDNYDTADMPTTASSLALAGLIPPDDAFQVRKLREAGAVILAKSNLHELAMGITSISSLGGQTRNPYDPLRNPGGSSGGTGAAIAASFAAVGWGSDTCGSIRIPSAHNALVGLRPTKGLSSVAGIIPLAHTQDVGGPMARTIMDLAIALDATIGPDPGDPATAALQGRTLPRFVAALDSGALRGARLGVLRELFDDPPADEEVARVVGAAIAQMEALGAEVVNVTIPELRGLLSGASVIDDEAKDDLADYLAGNPAAPVRSLDEIVERGLFHEALEATFRRRVR